MKPARAGSNAPRIAFIEAWVNPISVRFVNEFAKQHPDWRVYYLTDSDSIGKASVMTGNDSVASVTMDELSPIVRVVPLKNNKWRRRLTFAPLWLGGFLSKSLRARYLQTLYLHSFPKLSHELERIQPTVLQSNLLVMPYSWQAARYARRMNIPFILRTEEREPTGTLQRIAMNALLMKEKSVVHYATLIMPWSIQSEAFVRAQFLVPPERISLLPASVDISVFKPGERAARPKQKAGATGLASPIRLLTVQRFVAYKDYPTLLHGVRQAIDRGQRCTLAILGFGPEEKAIRALVHKLGLTAVVTFLPQRSYANMPQLYREYDVLVHTGRHEAIGMVVPEAMACGMVPLVCDTAGATTYLTPECGIVFKTGDAESLADALMALTEGSIAAMGARAAQQIASVYSVPNTVRAYTKLLEEGGKISFS